MKVIARSCAAALLAAMLCAAGAPVSRAAAPGRAAPTPAAPAPAPPTQPAQTVQTQPVPAVAGQPPAAAPSLTLGPSNSNNPVDITSEGLDVFQTQHLYDFKGNVEAVQDQARLRTPELRVYTKDKTQAPGAKPVAGAAPQMGSVDHMDAAGPVYYITPSENARGDLGHYDADSDTITLTGNVVLVQGKSVGKGDKLVINRKSGESNLISYAPKTAKGRVRVILYPQQQQPGVGAKPTSAPPGRPS